MIRAIEEFFKSIIRLLFRLLKDLSNYASSSSQPAKPQVPAKKPDSDLEPTGMEEPPPLAIEPPVILVECTSCGSIDKLTGICHVCHKPVCSRDFCEKDVFVKELNLWVIQCRNCTAAN
jgi:hypothetical protein